MKNMIRLLAAVAVIFAVAAQAAPLDGYFDEDSARPEKPAGILFTQVLKREYSLLSRSLDSTFGSNIRDAELFNHKALLASRRSETYNDSPLDRALSSGDRQVFVAANERLHNVFDKGGRELAATETAVAQVAYDCWIEATEDAHTQAASSCKAKFEQSIAAAEAKSNYVLADTPMPAPAPKVEAPAPKTVPAKEYYILPFEFDSTMLTPTGEQQLQAALADIKSIAGLKVSLRAHADRSGADSYNAKLSQRRAEAVLNRLAGAGVAREQLNIVEAVGESRPMVATADGQKSQENRVVEIDLRQ